MYEKTIILCSFDDAKVQAFADSTKSFQRTAFNLQQTKKLKVFYEKISSLSKNTLSLQQICGFNGGLEFFKLIE